MPAALVSRGHARYAQVVDADYTPRQVAELVARGEIQLVDVRQPHEHEAGRIAGDVHLELAQLTAQAHTIDAGRTVVFYCRSGARSAMATKAFGDAGFDAHNMSGGLLEWRAAGLPLAPAGGYVADP
ncbi:MAG: rhodanese-like domain-containing protein [Solirubrobacteraceae bacterium]